MYLIHIIVKGSTADAVRLFSENIKYPLFRDNEERVYLDDARPESNQHVTETPSVVLRFHCPNRALPKVQHLLRNWYHQGPVNPPFPAGTLIFLGEPALY